MTGHPSADELADAAEGLLVQDRAVVVATHVTECAVCRERTQALTSVSDLLAAEPRPPMPEAVAARLRVVLSQEAERRAARASIPPTPPRTTLGSFGADIPRRSLVKRVLPALVAVALAGSVGFGGYVISARAGLNEPPTVSAINSAELGPEASAVRQVSDLDPHRFSRAWTCARRLTDGRITGLASTVVDGVPALLVYTRHDGRTWATVITGCDTPEPSSGPSAVLSR